MTKKEQQKIKATEMLKQLGIFKPYVDGFVSEDKVCFFENYGGFYVDQEDEIQNKMLELEKEHKIKVYAITHEFTSFGECYDFLCVTNYKEEWDGLISDYNPNEFYAFAYCWNKDDDWCSEFGDIVVKSFGGGLKRIA